MSWMVGWEVGICHELLYKHLLTFFVRLPKVQEELSSEKLPVSPITPKRWLVYLDGFLFSTLWKDRRGNPNSLFVVRNSRVASDKHQ